LSCRQAGHTRSSTSRVAQSSKIASLLSDTVYILTRLLHPKKVYHYGGLNNYRGDRLNEFVWGLTMFLIYLNLIKPGVLVEYYRLMARREGELTDEEWMQRFQLRSQQAMCNFITKPESPAYGLALFNFRRNRFQPDSRLTR
jgi:hypothetical protein